MHYVRIRGVEPSLVLIAVVWYAIRVDSRRAAIYGLIAGLFEDVLATGTGGAWTISTTIAALTAGAISRGFFADSLPLVAMITVVVTLVRSLVFWVVWGFEGYPSGLAMLRFHEALLQALLNAILMAAVMLAARQFDKRFA
jgi:rod shape-determining protein MreD